VPHANLIVVGIVSWCNLYSTCTKFHINHDGIRDNGNATIWNEWMSCEFSVEMLFV
jgi:hypothetical protein